MISHLQHNDTRKEVIWKQMYDYENRYLISNYGRVISLKRNDGLVKEIALHKDKKGYWIFDAKGDNGQRNTKKIHISVLETFIGLRPKGLLGCHNDGNKDNNFVENLRWDTPSNNTKDAISQGTMKNLFKNGSEHHFSKLKEKDVIKIKKMLFPIKTKPYSSIAKIFNVSETTISSIHKERVWKQIQI